MGPWLCDVHGDLQTAARNAKDIFLDQMYMIASLEPLSPLNMYTLSYARSCKLINSRPSSKQKSQSADCYSHGGFSRGYLEVFTLQAVCSVLGWPLGRRDFHRKSRTCSTVKFQSTSITVEAQVQQRLG